MPVPKNKSDLQNSITDSYRRLYAELLSVPIEFTNKKEIEGHAKNTQISVNNLISYLVGWGQLVLKWNERKNCGLEVDFPETGYKWNQLGQLAQKFYNDYENDDFASLLDKLSTTTDEILNIIDSKNNDALYHVDWYGKWTLGKMIQLNTTSPFKNAINRIRKWKRGNYWATHEKSIMRLNQ